MTLYARLETNQHFSEHLDMIITMLKVEPVYSDLMIIFITKNYKPALVVMIAAWKHECIEKYALNVLVVNILTLML